MNTGQLISANSDHRLRAGMTSALRIGILGPFQVEFGDASSTIPVGKQRILLVALALRCGRAVGVDCLIDSLWDNDPPPSAPTTLRGHVKRLRKLLRTLTGGDELIESVAHGYRLRVDPETVDLHRFRQLCAAASAAKDPSEEKALLRESLGLWRGPALSDLGSEALLQNLGPVLEEERIQMLQRLVELDLQEGRYREAITAAHRLTTEHPFQERFWEQLMVALSKAGRTAEALGQFQRVRALLSEQLGVFPGPVLQAVHQLLLTENSTEASPRRSRCGRCTARVM